MCIRNWVRGREEARMFFWKNSDKSCPQQQSHGARDHTVWYWSASSRVSPWAVGSTPEHDAWPTQGRTRCTPGRVQGSGRRVLPAQRGGKGWLSWAAGWGKGVSPHVNQPCVWSTEWALQVAASPTLVLWGKSVFHLAGAPRKEGYASSLCCCSEPDHGLWLGNGPIRAQKTLSHSTDI